MITGVSGDSAVMDDFIFGEPTRRSAEIPLPAAAWMMLAGLGALGALRAGHLGVVAPDQPASGRIHRVDDAPCATRVEHAVVNHQRGHLGAEAVLQAVPGLAVPAHHAVVDVLNVEDHRQPDDVAGGDDVTLERDDGLEPVAVVVDGADAAAQVHPRLAAVVVIDEPGGELYYGSDVAAPVFADVMSESLRLLAVPPDAMPARDPGSIMQAMSR